MTPQVFFESSLTQTDPMVLDAIKNEYHRQNDQIELIASENIVSKAVLEAQVRYLQTSMLKVTLVKDIMVGVSTWMLLKTSVLIE